MGGREHASRAPGNSAKGQTTVTSATPISIGLLLPRSLYCTGVFSKDSFSESLSLSCSYRYVEKELKGKRWDVDMALLIVEAGPEPGAW